MNRFAKMKKERIYTLFETLSRFVSFEVFLVSFMLDKIQTKKPTNH